MDENRFVYDVMIPSLMNAAGHIPVSAKTNSPASDTASANTAGDITGNEPIILISAPKMSVDLHGSPGVLLTTADETIQISVRPLTETADTYMYRVEVSGFKAWEFPADALPEDIEYFSLLPILYDRIRYGAQQQPSALAGYYESTRLPALREVLAGLSMNTVLSDHNGRTVAIAIEENEPVIFYYDYTIPELELTALVVEFDDQQYLIPEFGNISDAEHYAKVLSALT